MTKKKRVNPHKIPLKKNTYDAKSLLYEEMHENLYFAWMLIIHTLVEQNIASSDKVREIWLALDDSLITYKLSQYQISYASNLLKTPEPYPNLEIAQIRSEADVASFRRKARKEAIFLALCSLSLAFEKSACLSKNLLQKTFLNISLSLAEIDGGYMTFEKLNEDLCNHGIHLVVGENDLYLYVQAGTDVEGALGPEEHTQAVEKADW